MAFMVFLQEARWLARIRRMGLTFIDAELAAPGRPRRWEGIRFRVDSGAISSLAPGRVLRRLGIRPLRREDFELADGSTMRRRVGLALFRVGNKVGGSEVDFASASGISRQDGR